MRILYIYLAAVNILGGVLCALDKYKAKRGKWRIRERTFFIISLLGGGVGVYVSMWIFRHKTLHKRFTLGIPAIIILQAAAAVYLYLIL